MNDQVRCVDQIKTLSSHQKQKCYVERNKIAYNKKAEKESPVRRGNEIYMKWEELESDSEEEDAEEEVAPAEQMKNLIHEEEEEENNAEARGLLTTIPGLRAGRH